MDDHLSKALGATSDDFPENAQKNFKCRALFSSNFQVFSKLS